ncbi:hypothetical protein [Sphingomonas sp.]|uniref:hypothetical protein n=1 Tax=Sphingomonas sp. TaxID=28214 RepID=UPI003B008FCF
MVRLLREYQLFKHGEIFDPTIAGGTARQVALARELKARCIAAGERYAEHSKRWSMTDVAGEWPDYKLALHAIIDALRDHMRDEREAVALLLAGRERTRSLVPLPR